MVLREEETLAATAGHGNTSRARDSTSLKRKAGLAHTTGDAAAGLDTDSSPSSTSTSWSMGARPERNGRPPPLMRHKQEVNISNGSRAHDPKLPSPGRKKKYGLQISQGRRRKQKNRSLSENPKNDQRRKKKKKKNIPPEMKDRPQKKAPAVKC